METQGLPDLAVVLERTNDIRMALAIGEGKLPELPKGYRSSASQCVLARALSNGWSASVGEEMIILTHQDVLPDEVKLHDALEKLGFDATVWKSEHRINVEIRTPAVLSEFIRVFDDGLFPHLILER